MGQLRLPASGSVYVDTSAVIYSVEKIDPYWTVLQPLWQAAQQGQFIVLSSELVLLETLVKPLKEADTVLETTFRELLLASKEVQLIPVSLSILEKAAHLRASTGLKSPDAIHAATALSVGSPMFVTNETIFKRVSGLTVVVLHEVL
jgi:predicted nucleic acid-binding protein